MSAPLPAGFETLEPFVTRWVQDGFQARLATRYDSDMEEIRRFYDAITPLADKALEELGRHDMAALPESHLTLLSLVLALAHVAVSVERYGQPRPRNVTWPARVSITMIGPQP